MWRDNWASRMLFTGPERWIVSQGLFDGLDETARDELHAQLRPRVLPAGAVPCRAGDRSDSLYLVERGVLHVLDGNTGALLGRQRAGDVVGEVALLTGEPRSATLLARVPGAVSELSRGAFLAVAARHPVLLANLARIVSRRLVERTTAAPAKITALLTGPAGWAGAVTAVATARAASAAPLTVLDATGAEAGPVRGRTAPGGGITPAHELRARLDAAAAAGPVLLHVRTDHGDLAELLDYCDRTVAVLPADGGPDAALAALLPSDVSRVEPTADPAWLGRRLARASVGIAFGAGGAKGWRTSVRCAACSGPATSWTRSPEQYRRLGRGVDGAGSQGEHRRAAAAGPLRRGRRAGHVPPRRRRRHRGDRRAWRERRPQTPGSPTWQCR